jgi:hypothetical protein
MSQKINCSQTKLEERKNLTKESQQKLLHSKIGEKKEPNKRISTKTIALKVILNELIIYNKQGSFMHSYLCILFFLALPNKERILCLDAL